MKKIISTLMLMAAVVLFAACSGDATSSPKNLVDKVMSLQQSQDFDAIVDLMCDKNGEPLSEEAAQQLKSFIAEKVKPEQEVLKSYQIVEEKISDDGKEAVVKVKALYEGEEEKIEEMRVLKGADGKWRVPLDK